MKYLSRDQFAAAALPSCITEYMFDEAVPQAFAFADEAVALSAPDAIEALRELVESIEVVFEKMRVEEPELYGRKWDCKTVIETARAVLARYKETSQ